MSECGADCGPTWCCCDEYQGDLESLTYTRADGYLGIVVEELP